MKATGIVRRIDDLGRVVIPKEIRRMLNAPEGTLLEFVSDGESVTFRKYVPDCVLCRSSDKPIAQLHPGKFICTDCINTISNNRPRLLNEAMSPVDFGTYQ